MGLALSDGPGPPINETNFLSRCVLFGQKMRFPGPIHRGQFLQFRFINKLYTYIFRYIGNAVLLLQCAIGRYVQLQYTTLTSSSGKYQILIHARSCLRPDSSNYFFLFFLFFLFFSILYLFISSHSVQSITKHTNHLQHINTYKSISKQTFILKYK